MEDKIATLYIHGIKEELKTYWAGWLPNSEFSLGDIGILKGKVFRPLSNLADSSNNIQFDKSENSSVGTLEYSSKSGIELSFTAAGQSNLPDGTKIDGSIDLKFSSEGAFFIKLIEANEVSIKDLLSVEKSIIDNFKSGFWDKDWVVISKIINAPTGNFFISNSSESSVEYEIKGKPNIGLVDFGSANIQHSLKSQKGSMIKMLNATDVSPFFQLSKLSCKWFRHPILDQARGFVGEIEPIDFITPEIAKNSEDISQNLCLKIVN